MIWQHLKSLHQDLHARFARLFATRQIVEVLRDMHVRELATTPGEQWPQIRSQQLQQIQAVRDGKFDIVDRRSWAYPYLPEALHRLNQPVLKNCFSSDTEVLTRRGWVLMPEVRKGDWVLSRMDDGTAKWVEVKKLFKYRYRGKMLHFGGKYCDLLVSPDHRMYGRFRAPVNVPHRTECADCGGKFKTPAAWGSHRRRVHGIHAASPRKRWYAEYGPVGFAYAKDVAEWLRKHEEGPRGVAFAFEVPVQTEWAGVFPAGYDVETDTVPVQRNRGVGKGSYWMGAESVRVPLKDLVAFLGLYLAEGSSAGTLRGLDLGPHSKKPHYIQALAAAAESVPRVDEADSGRHNYGVGIAQTTCSEHYEEVEQLLSRLPWNFCAEVNGFAAHDRNLYGMTFPLGNSYTKYVPDWVKELPPEYLRIFLVWHRRGDGHLSKVGSCTSHYTASKRLADDLQEIYLKAGWEASIHKIRQRGSPAWGIQADRQAPLYRVGQHRFTFKGLHSKNIGEVRYDGYIYCPAIPPYETVYVRRRQGIACWCGRTPYNL